MEFSKHQDKERLLSLDDKWELIPFQELFDSYSGGKHKIKKGDYLGSGEYPIIDQGEKFIGGYTNDPEKLIDGPLPKVIFGDHTRRFKYIDFRFGVGADGTKILTPKKECYVKYLYYYFKSINLPNTGYNRHFKYLKRFIVPLPPLEIQKKIAAVLDKADALRPKRSQTIAKLDELTQSVFLDMFGDPYFNQKNFPLGTIRDMVGTTKYGTNKKAHEEDGEYPVIRMGNLTYSGEWDFTDMKYVDLEDDELEKYMVYEGDVLFNRTNSKELVGKTGVYRRENPMAYAGYLIRVRTNEKANSEFLSGFLNSPYGKKKLEHMCKSIVGMANINAQEMQDIETIIPCINLQNEYKEKIKSIRKQRKNFELSLTKLDLLFNALLQKAFKGGLESSDSEEQLLAAEEVAEYSAG